MNNKFRMSLDGMRASERQRVSGSVSKARKNLAGPRSGVGHVGRSIVDLDAAHAQTPSAGVELHFLVFASGTGNGRARHHGSAAGEPARLEMNRKDAPRAEFQKMLDHRGLVWNCATAILAHLGIARGYALAGDTTKAKVALPGFPYEMERRRQRLPHPHSREGRVWQANVVLPDPRTVRAGITDRLVFRPVHRGGGPVFVCDNGAHEVCWARLMYYAARAADRSR